MASSNALSCSGHAKNSFAPARMDWRMRSGLASAATTKIAPAVPAARSRSTVVIASDRSCRPSTMATSEVAAAPRARRLSMTLTRTLPARSMSDTLARKMSSVVRIAADSRAMSLHQPDSYRKTAGGSRACVVVDDAENRRDTSNDVVAAARHDEEADPVRHFQRGVAAVHLAVLVVIRVEQRNREHARTRVLGRVHLVLRRVPIGVRILGDQIIDALVRRADHVAGFLRHRIAEMHEV